MKSKDQRLITRAITDYLQASMVRRLKRDVIHQLPAFNRQRWETVVPGGPLVEDYLSDMLEAGGNYEKAYGDATGKGGRAAEAAGRRAALPMLSVARRLLGLAKAHELATVELIASVVAERGCAAVFGHHHDVLDAMAQALWQRGRLRVVQVGGRSAAEERAHAVAAFDAGEADVFVGGVTVMDRLGLPRTDTAVFLEFDWVPAVMLPAEARLFRPAAQGKSSLHIIQVVTRLGADQPNLDIDMLDLLDEKNEDHCTCVERYGYRGYSNPGRWPNKRDQRPTPEDQGQAAIDTGRTVGGQAGRYAAPPRTRPRATPAGSSGSSRAPEGGQGLLVRAASGGATRLCGRMACEGKGKQGHQEPHEVRGH